MANAYLNMARTTTLPTIVTRAKLLARIGVSSTSHNFLGDTAGVADTNLVYLVNDAQRDVKTDFPLLGVTQDAAIALVAAQRYSTLPATLRHNDIIKFLWDDTDETYDERPIRFITEEEAERLPSQMRLATFTETFPSFCYIPYYSSTGAAIVHWIGMPSIARTAKVQYRATDVVYTSTQLTVPGIIYTDIPDVMLDLLATKVAIKIQECNAGAEGASVAALINRYEILKDQWVGELSQSALERRQATLGIQGYESAMVEEPLGTFDFYNTE